MTGPGERGPDAATSAPAPAPAGPEHWLDLSRARVIGALVLAANVAVAAGFVWSARGGVDRFGKPLGYDFLAFYAASKLTLAGAAAAAYDPGAHFAAEHAVVPGIVTHTAFQYPPSYLLLVLPLALVPYLPSYLLFVGSSLAVYVAVVRRVLAFPAGLLPLIAFPGIFVCAWQGQNGLFTAALVGGGLLVMGDRPGAAGLAFGLLSVKPHLALLVPFALLGMGAFRALGTAIVTACALAALAFGVLGREPFVAFLARLPEVARALEAGELPLRKMPTLFALARGLHLPVAAAYGVQAVAAVLVIVAVVALARRSAPSALLAAGVVTGSLLQSPYLFDYDLAWLGVALAFYLPVASRAGFGRGERELLLLVWLLPMAVPLLHDAARAQLAPIVLVAFFALIVRRAWLAPREATPPSMPAS